MNYKFSDLIEVAKVQRLNDLFYKATGIPTAVIDPEGAIITCSGWQEICTKFHRVNEGTAQQCVESDTVFANQIGVGQKYTVYKCGNGLVVAASPIAIDGEHVANFITSQFLFHPPDRGTFLEQAKRFGFDEAAYMEAVGKIPVVDEARLQPFLEYFSEFASMLGEMGLKQLRQLDGAAALRESEQRSATTVSSIGDAVIATDKDGRITFMNPVAEALTGWPLAEAATRPVAQVFNIINEKTRKSAGDPVAGILKGGVIVGLANHTILVRKDGTEVSIDDSGAPIRDRDGNIIGVVLVFRDITERRRAEEELLRAKEEWELTFDSVPDMIAIIDAEHRILRVNSAMARRLGRKAEECVGVHCYEAVHGLSAPPFFCPHSRSLKDGGQHIEEITEDRLGGCFLVSTTPLRVPDDQIIRTVHVAHDITERKRAEEALRESQTQMNRAQEIAHLGSWELDLMNNRLSWSDEVYRIFGLQPREFGATYNAFLEAVHPEDREAVDAAYSGSLREGRDTYEIEHRVVRRSSGEIRIVHEKCEHFRDETGRIVKSVGMVHDITERKRAEQELREAHAELERKVAERTAELQRSEAYLAEGQRLSHTGSWARDAKTLTAIYWSEELFRIYGFDPQQGLPMRSQMLERIHPEDRDKFNLFDRVLHEKVDCEAEYRIVLPDGTVKHVHAIAHPVLTANGEAVQVVGTIIDITERKRAEEERRQSAERFRAIADYTYDWEYWIGVDGKLLWLNPAVERITGYSVDECMGMSDFPIPIVAEADRETVARQIREAIQGSSRNDFEFRVRHKDGRLPWVAASWQPIYDLQGTRLGHRSSIRDISERKQAQEALQKLMAELELRVEERTNELSEANQALQAANKELESFSYSVSHDLRAPLRAIDGFSRMVLMGYADKLDDEGRRKLNVIRSNAQQMDKLISDLLAFSRLGRKEMVQASLNMDALVRSAWKELTLLNPERRIQFSVKRLPHAMGDEALMREVVVNLLSNAIEFSKFRENAIVEVGAYAEKETNVYFVKDNGVGFDMEYYDKLFGVFQRLHSSDEFEGTGVGLAIVERIIRRHGGRVWAEGKVGEGATFYFALPRKE
jgi:PAS domain S-box-containing protein